MFAVPRERISRIHASSGTTGQPTVVGYTANDIDMWSDVMARSIRAAGGRPGDRAHIAYGYGLFTGGLGAHYGAERLGCAVIPISGGMTERQVTLIRDFEPDFIMVTPSYMLSVIDEMERQGIDPAKTSLKLGIFGAEPWTNDMRQEMESRLDMHAIDIYGLSEVIGPGVGVECVDTKDGLHIWEDHFYPEIIDPITGEVLPDGSYGELVFTSLTKEAMPVVRYRTRDLTRLLPGTARPMRRIEKITGRSDDMIILRGVNLFPTQIEELILRVPSLSPHFQCELARPGRMDTMTVRVERRPGIDPHGRRSGRCCAGQAGEEPHRRHGRRRRRRPGRHRTVGRQDAAHHRQPAEGLTAPGSVASVKAPPAPTSGSRSRRRRSAGTRPRYRRHTRGGRKPVTAGRSAERRWRRRRPTAGA